jgi:hypothetical protein
VKVGHILVATNAMLECINENKSGWLMTTSYRKDWDPSPSPLYQAGSVWFLRTFFADNGDDTSRLEGLQSVMLGEGCWGLWKWGVQWQNQIGMNEQSPLKLRKAKGEAWNMLCNLWTLQW